MKVLHVETGRHLYGGAQQVLYLSRGLAKRGHDSIIVCQPGSAIGRAAREWQLPVAGIRCGGDLDVTFAFRLRHLLVEQRPDIVHCHSRRGADFFGGRAAQMAGVPAIVSRRVDSEETALLASWRYASFQRIVAISDNVADAVRRSLCNAGRVVVIRSAVDTDAMQPGLPRRDWRREFGLDEDDVVLVVAAQLIERKGHRLLFEALATLPPAAPRWRLLVCGRGPLERELRQLCARLGLDPVVRFAGFRNDLDNWLGHADMLVHPACEEGLGVAMLKAAAAGLPVVALDVAGAREAVVDGQTGVLVPPADPQALAQALAALIADARQRQQLGTAGTERMRSEFSIDEMVERHLDLYRDVSRAASCVA